MHGKYQLDTTATDRPIYRPLSCDCLKLRSMFGKRVDDILGQILEYLKKSLKAHKK